MEGRWGDKGSKSGVSPHIRRPTINLQEDYSTKRPFGGIIVEIGPPSRIIDAPTRHPRPTPQPPSPQGAEP